MRRRNLVVGIAAVILLASLAYANSPDVSVSVPSNGTVEYENPAPLTVILRGIPIESFSAPADINAYADSYVANHPHVTAILLGDMHQYGIWWYGYTFSKTSGTWMAWTFAQLKTLIDRFHYDGWKVGIDTSAIAWDGQEEYNYMTELHPELAFTNDAGMRCDGITNASNNEMNPGYHRVIPDPFAVFTTPDTTNNITVGTRLVDLYTTRLTQMIKDGLQWDFWFGSDGWNGFNIQGYSWDTSTPGECISFSRQEENVYGNWSSAILPSNWNTLNQTAAASAIISNPSCLNCWWQYWQRCFAQEYAQIKQAFINAGESTNTFHVIAAADVSSQPTGGGNNSPYGMMNQTLMQDYQAIDYYYIDVEGISYVGADYGFGREAAYSAALIKMQNATLTPIIGLQLDNWGHAGTPYPLWEVEQEYLAQAVNYVWINGARYRVAAPNIVMLQYPIDSGYNGWTLQQQNELFSFIQSTAYLLENANPVWLGPVYPLPNAKSGNQGMAWWALNYSIAQWAWSANLANNPQYINQSMGTFILDEALRASGPTLTGLYDTMVNQLWGTGQLNLWYWESVGAYWDISSVFPGNGPTAENNFHITPSAGSTYNYTILSGFTDPVAQWITSGYEGTACVIDAPSKGWDHYGEYLPETGFVNIANFTYDSPNRIGIGYYKNSTTGNFLLTHMPGGDYSQNIVVPRSMISKMLYWVSSCPINSSEPLIDLKILDGNNGTILIPMTNQRDVGCTYGPSDGTGWNVSSTLNLNAQSLGLGNELNYNIYWASNPSSLLAFSSWNNIAVTLSNMADVLVIARK